MSRELPTLDQPIHVWIIPLELPVDSQTALEELLSPDELERANRFIFLTDRRRFVVARGAMRSVLGRYLDMSPSTVGFNYGPRGKPVLRDGAGRSTLRFNLAHSHEFAVLAVGYGRELGIDLELIRPIEDSLAIAERFFTPSEQSRIKEVAGAASTALFLAYWTRKEAILKLTGQGLSLPLNQVPVTWPGDISPIEQVEDAEAHVWRLRVGDFRLPNEYCGAVAAEGDSLSVEWRFYAADK